MDRWIDKTAVVTGASSGIGEAISIALVEHGLKVVGLARRVENMKKLVEKLKDAKGTFYPLQCDVSKEGDLLKGFKFAETLGGVDIMVNNAGIHFTDCIIDSSTENFKAMLDINVLAAAICIREATRSMRERNVEGHIINVSSIFGHNASLTVAPLNLYQTSKFALTAMSEVVRNEISVKKLPIKVTNLSPGLVKTEMPAKKVGDKIFDMFPHIMPEDIASVVLFVLGTPPNVQVTELGVTPLHECPFIGTPKNINDTIAEPKN